MGNERYVGAREKVASCDQLNRKSCRPAWKPSVSEIEHIATSGASDHHADLLGHDRVIRNPYRTQKLAKLVEVKLTRQGTS